MTMKKRTFTKKEKLRIIKEASEKGVNETLEKYGIYRTSYYDWKRKFEQMGQEGFMQPDGQEGFHLHIKK